MNTWTKILAGALVVQLGLIALVRLTGNETKVATLEPVVDGLDAASIQGLVLFPRADAKPDASGKAPGPVTLVRDGDGWKVTSHYNYPGATDKIDKLLSSLGGMRARGTVTTNKARHRQLKVADDNYLAKVEVKREGGNVTLLIGGPAGPRKNAVRIAGEDAVYGVQGLSSGSVTPRVASWIDTKFRTGTADSIVDMTITNQHGTISLSKATGAWQRMEAGAPVPVPEGKVFDTTKVDGFARKLATIYAAEPADPNAPPASDAVTVQFTVKDATTSETLQVGPDVGGKHYVRLTGKQHPVLVNSFAVKTLIDAKADDLYKDPPKEGDAPPAGPAPGGIQGLPPGVQLPPGFQ